MGHVPRQSAQRANPLLWHASLYSPDSPVFSLPNMAYITPPWAFGRLLRHGIWNKGARGAGGTHRGDGHGNSSRENLCPPSPNQFVQVT